MSEAAAVRADRELQMLEAMVDCAYALGAAFGEAAKAERDPKRRLDLFDAFLRGSQAVRMGIRLSLTLRAAPKPARPTAIEPEPYEVDRHETERPETERAEGLERERERDYEPVSLPRFLATLGVVVRDTARLDGLPADIRTRTLPALVELLAQAKTGVAAAPPRSSAGVDILTRPPPAPPRARLLGSTSAILPRAVPGGLPRPPPRRSG